MTERAAESDYRTVAHYMATDVMTFPPDLEINHAVARLIEREVSGAPVVDESGALIGILTTKDCFKAALHAAYHQQWGGVVADYMGRDVECLDVDLDIVSAAAKFMDSSYRRFPVTAEGRLVGIISRGDLLRAFTEHW